MLRRERLTKKVIKFVKDRVITTVDAICKEFGFSISTFYRLKGKRLVTSINENSHYVTTSARVKRGRDNTGLYRHGNIIFHTKSDIKEIIVDLIGHSQKGFTEGELYNILDIHCHRKLDYLIENKRLIKIQVGRSSVYFTKRRWKIQFKTRLEAYNSNVNATDSKELMLSISDLTKILDDLLPLPDEKRAKHEYTPLTKFKALCTLFALSFNSYEDMEVCLAGNENIRNSICGDDNRVIDHTTLCYFMGRLTENELTNIFIQLVKECQNYKLINGKYLAVDATHLFAWYNTHRNTDKHPIEGASWGHKSKKKSFFGYKLHILVDCKAELPIAFIISTGKDHDSTHFIPLLKFTKENYGELVDSEIFSDSAYWDIKLVKEAKIILKAELYSAINPRRNKIWKNIKSAIQVFFTKYDRAPVTHEELMAVLNQKTLDKYGIDINNTILAEKSKLMRAVKERMNRLYRAAVERTFSRLKTFFRLNSIKTQKWSSVKKHIIMSMITMLLMAIAMHKKGIPPDKRKFVKIGCY
jgi:transposase